MDWQETTLFAVLLIVGASINGAYGAGMVTGTVFCDQCKDGEVSLFDYPLIGMKVSVYCPGENGQLILWREEITNFLGGYVMRFDGTPDMSGCRAQVSGVGQQDTVRFCGAVAGPARDLRLMFKMFGLELYHVDPLISQPDQPSAFCPRSNLPGPMPVTPTLPPRPVTPALPPPPVAPALPPPSVTPTLPPLPVTPALPPPVKLGRMPPLPPLPPMPPLPLEASACPYQMWLTPEYHCYWRVLMPDMKVAVVFGPWAGMKYGTDITLRQSLSGRGEPYRTLLREATTAILNSYNSVQFPYHPFEVVEHLNFALMEPSNSTRHVLVTAWRFMRANTGKTSNTTCKFKPCK